MLRRRAINVPRRTLRRHARSLPLHLQVQELVLQVGRAHLPKTLTPEQLEAVLKDVWLAGLGVWSVSQLKTQKILPATVSGNSVGQALGKLADSGLALGPWIVQRADEGHGKSWSEGRLWQLARRW